MSKKLYLECYAGISGDMTVAALLDLGVNKEKLLNALESLPVTGFVVDIKRVKKVGIDACDFNVILDKKHENHDHDMEYLHGDAVIEVHNSGHSHSHDDDHHHSQSHDHHHEHSHDHDHDHSHEHSHGYHHDHSHEHNHDHHDSHTHTHSHGHSHHHHEHQHRGMKEITEIIQKAVITPRAKQIALDIFQVIGEAEAKAHDLSIDEVHFHEVGAVDSIVDIVAVAVCLDDLGIDEVIVPVLYEGVGTVRCQHGILPIPVPAVANIAEKHHLNLKITNTQGEFITPTGAAIVAAIKTGDKLPDNFKINKVGIGAGKRNYERPSMLRAMLIEERHDDTKADVIYKLESNIDDCSGEVLGYVMERLFEAGARDVNYMPVYMKKNRPAYQINVICKEENIRSIEKILFEETTTIGIRRQRMERTILERDIVEIQTSLGEAQLKVCRFEGQTKIYPEYDSVIRLSKQHKLTFNHIYQLLIKEYYEQF